MKYMNKFSKIKSKSFLFESPYYKLVVLAMGVFMMGMDVYIFSPALVTIVKYFNTSYNWVTWTITVYLLFSTAVMPLGGKLADVFGRKKIFIVGISIFTIGSLLSSLSWNIYSLVAFRAIQAIGGGIIIPSALSAMSSYAPKNKQGKTLGALISASVIATIIGPNIGGFLIENFGWRTIFYINIPIGILTILLTLQFSETYSQEKHNIDIFGTILLGLVLISMLLGLIGLETLPFYNIQVFPYFIISISLLLILIFYESHISEPLLNLHLLSRKETLGLNIAFLLTFTAISCTVMFVPSFVQLTLKSGVQISGTILTPYTVTVFIMSILGGIVIDKIGTRRILLIGLLIASIGFFLMANYVSNYTSLIIVLIIVAVGWGMSSGAFQVSVLISSPESEKGSSSAILNTFKGIGGMITPIIGGYFLTNTANKIYTINTAFNAIFMIASVLLIIADLLLILITIIPKSNNNVQVDMKHLIDSQVQ